MAILLIDEIEFKKQGILGGGIDADKFWPALKSAQLMVIKPLLGKDLYDKICDDYFNDTLTGLYQELYDDYIKMLLIYKGSEYFLATGAYSIANNGITKINVENSQSISKEEVDYLVQFNRKLYNEYEKEFLKWIKDNGSSIPEWEVNICNTPKTQNIGGWVVSRNKYKGYNEW